MNEATDAGFETVSLEGSLRVLGRGSHERHEFQSERLKKDVQIALVSSRQARLSLISSFSENNQSVIPIVQLIIGDFRW